MLRQTILPDEIVIADDGSGEETRELIKRLQKESSVPIIHVWQEDDGFRKTIILNKAIAKITGEYILQVDGDVILSRHFVSDHLELAEKNHFVCGSRVKLDPKITERIFKTGIFPPRIWEMPLGFMPTVSVRACCADIWQSATHARLTTCEAAIWHSGKKTSSRSTATTRT